MLKLIQKSLLFHGNYQNVEEQKELLNVWFRVYVYFGVIFYFNITIISLPCGSGFMSSCSSPPSPFVPGHLTGCCRGFPTFLWLSPLCSVLLVFLSPCHLSHNLCLLCRMLLNIFLHVPSSLLHLPLCLLLWLLPLVSLSLVSSQEAVEHFLPPGLQERGQVQLCLMCHLL